MIFELFKAFLVGILASAPLGPVVLLVTQNTLAYGQRTGFTTGLGAALVDTTYAVICFFAVSFVQEYILDHQAILMTIGGFVIIFIGIRTLLKKLEFPSEDGKYETHYVSNFFKAFGMSIANPGALVLMLGIVALLNIDILGGKSPVICMVLAVAAGAVTFWFLFSCTANLFRKSIQANHLKWINMIFGIAVIVFGIVLSVRGILMF